MNEEEADALVTKARDLRHQLETCTNIVDHQRICAEYCRITGSTMFFPVAQYDELYDKATPEEHERARRLYPGNDHA